YADRCFLASLRDHGEFYLARLDIKDRIGSIPLRKDSLFPLEKQRSPALANGCEECMRIEIAPRLGRYIWNHGITLRLECRVNWDLAGDLPSAWKTVGLASRRHSQLLAAQAATILPLS